jgi:hypothetical protein
VPWSRAAAVLAINRLCEPGSELAIEERWYPSTALDDLYRKSPNSVTVSAASYAIACKEREGEPRQRALRARTTTRVVETIPTATAPIAWAFAPSRR